MPKVSQKTVGRLSLYRRLLNRMFADGARNVYSHDLARMAGGTAAQVRRDLMTLGHTGSPKRGYDVKELSDHIGAFLDAPDGQGVALIGVGNLGRAILSYFAGRRPKLAITVAFDNDPAKVNRVIHGCRCHPISELSRVVREQNVRVAILTVPAREAQSISDELVEAGVRGVLNFAPVPLRVPPGTYSEDIDMTMSLETVAYFARKGTVERETEK